MKKWPQSLFLLGIYLGVWLVSTDSDAFSPTQSSSLLDQQHLLSPLTKSFSPIVWAHPVKKRAAFRLLKGGPMRPSQGMALFLTTTAMVSLSDTARMAMNTAIMPHLHIGIGYHFVETTPFSDAVIKPGNRSNLFSSPRVYPKAFLAQLTWTA